MNVTVAMIVCAVLFGDHNIDRFHTAEVAAVEANAFLGVPRVHVSLVTLLAVAYVESRFSPTGSQRDRDNGVWGVMQVRDLHLRCHDTYRHLGCTPDVRIAQEHLLDPAVNIRIGASLLERAWLRAHVRTPRDWVGAYFWGSVPSRAHAMRAYRHYAARVRGAERLMARRLRRCSEQGGE